MVGGSQLVFSLLVICFKITFKLKINLSPSFLGGWTVCMVTGFYVLMFIKTLAYI
jgi:hypothetical protein